MELQVVVLREGELPQALELRPALLLQAGVQELELEQQKPLPVR